MLRLNCVLVALLLLTLSCKKTKESPKAEEPVILPQKKIDTIKPLPYIPAYPGSYWTYSDGSKIVTSSTYQIDTFHITISPGLYKWSQQYYVPLYNNTPLWGYRMHSVQIIYADRSDPFVRVISDSFPVGSGWTTYVRTHYSHKSKIIAKDTTINISGKDYYPTIVLYHTEFHFIGSGTITSPLGRSYYTKNIGLVKYETLGDSGKVIKEKVLVDYFINK